MTTLDLLIRKDQLNTTGLRHSHVRGSADPFYTVDTEDTQALLRPLFITSWLIDDFLADNQFLLRLATRANPSS